MCQPELVKPASRGFGNSADRAGSVAGTSASRDTLGTLFLVTLIRVAFIVVRVLQEQHCNLSLKRRECKTGDELVSLQNRYPPPSQKKSGCRPEVCTGFVWCSGGKIFVRLVCWLYCG